MLSYSTLKEAYNVSSIHKTPEKKIVKNERENFINPPPEKNDCGPLTVPNYEIPISEEAKNRADEAMKNFLKQQQINKPIKSNLDHLQSFAEDDMDQYLNVSDFNKPIIPQNITTTNSNNIPNNIPNNITNNIPNNISNNISDIKNNVIIESIEKPTQELISYTSPTSFSDIYIELFIFLLIGILIISLCEMIVRIVSA